MDSTSQCTNLNADLLDGRHSNQFVQATTASTITFDGGTIGGGTGVATFVGTAKPGGNTSNGWIKLTIDSTTLYIPVWQ